MTRTYIVVALDHHSATKALDRVLGLLDYARDGYAVDGLYYTVYRPEDLDERVAAFMATGEEGTNEQRLPHLPDGLRGHWDRGTGRLRRRLVLGVRAVRARLGALHRR